MIEVQGLTKIYGALKAIDDVTFHVEKGQILGFLGPNGAGKTTTMRILAGAQGATQGSAKIAGFEIHEKPREAKRRLGYMPEFPPLYTGMTVHAYMHFAAKIKGVPRRERAKKVDRAMEQTGLIKARKRVIGQLSKGYRQRVGLAQALVHEPEILILDEPTSGLDPAQIHEVRDVIKGLGGDHTVILSTHILPEVTMTCDRVVIIDRGRIVADDSEASLAQLVAGEQRVQVQVARPGDAAFAALQGVEGVDEVESAADGFYRMRTGERDLREAIAQTMVDGGHGLLELQTEVVSLEQIYLRLLEGGDNKGGAGALGVKDGDAPAEPADAPAESAEEDAS